MALAVPLSRFTPRVGGGSAFFVGHKFIRYEKINYSFSRRWSQAVIFEAVEHRLFASWLCSAVSAILLPDAEFCPSMSLSFTHRPNQSPEPTAVGAYRSAVAVHAASRRWLSFFR